MNKWAKYSIEFVLIFLSVVLAFLFEDYRSKKEEKKNYLTALKSFRQDLYKEFVGVKSGYLSINDQQPSLLKYDSLLSLIESSEDPLARLSTFKQIHYLSINDNAPISLWYEKLSDYPFHVQSDQIDYLMNWYLNNRQTRQKMYDLCAETMKNFWEGNTENLDLANIENELNRPVANSLEFGNVVIQTHDFIKVIISFDTFYCQNFLDTEIKSLDKILTQHNVDISDLESDELF